VRTLEQWVQAASDEELRGVLECRPDVRSGAPLVSRGDLLDRLQSPPAILLVVRGLPSPVSQLLDALVALGGYATVAELTQTLAGADEQEVRRWLQVLAEHVLIVPGDDEQVVVNPGVCGALGSLPGLGPSAREIAGHVPVDALAPVVRAWGLTVPRRKQELVDAVATQLHDAAFVRRQLAQAPDEVLGWLLAFAQHGVQVARAVAAGGVPPEPPEALHGPTSFRTGVLASQWAREHGLAFPGWTVHEMAVPSEVTIALGGPAELPFDPVAPEVPTAPVAVAQVDRAAAAALVELLGTFGTVLDQVRARPAATIAAGGIGAREIARVAKACSSSVAMVRLTFETAANLGLLATVDGKVGVAPSLDGWRGRPPTEQVLAIWAAWLDLTVHPTRDRDDEDKALPVLGRAAVVAPELREEILQWASHLGQDHEARAVPDRAALAEALRWADPYAGPDAGQVATVWEEATLLGLVALDTVTAAAHDLIATDAVGARTRIESLLPDVAHTAKIGSDLTVVVGGVPSADVVDLLDLLADRESRGAASTWRLTPASIRRGFDAGWDADEVLERLRALASSLPQSVEYAVKDVGRRYGQVVVRPVACVLVVPDDALRAELLVAQAVRGLGLAPVDGAVLSSSADAPTVLERLRSAGYLPVETDAGGVRVVRGAPDGSSAGDAERPAEPPDDERARLSAATAELLGVTPSLTSATRTLVDVDVALASMLGGPSGVPDEATETVLAQVAPHTRGLSVLDRRQLAWAVAHRTPVQIEYRSSSGSVSVRVVSGLVATGTLLNAWCHLRDDVRQFRLDGLQRVVPLTITAGPE